MLTAFTRVKIVAFVLIAIVTLSYIATTYADLGRYLGRKGHYTVDMRLAGTGGLFKGSAVSYRGVTIGRVGDLNLDPAHNGVIAELRIDKSNKTIPANLAAVVADRSAVGEQYVDLRPNTEGAPYLRNGSRIDQSVTTIPRPVTETLKSVNDFTASVPLAELQTVIRELGTAFAGQGPNLQHLLDTGDQFINTADANFDTLATFIDNGEAVLRTQNQEAASLRTIGTRTREFAAALKGSDADLRRLIKVTVPFNIELSKLLRDLDPGFSQLLANLLNNAQMAEIRQPNLRELLSNLPVVAAIGNTVVRNGRLEGGLVNTFFNPLPCVRGYGGTTYRNGLDLSKPLPFNSGARCTSPASTGVNVRGAAHAPLVDVPDPGSPPKPIPGLGTPATPGGDNVNASTSLAGLLGLTGGPR